MVTSFAMLRACCRTAAAGVVLATLVMASPAARAGDDAALVFDKAATALGTGGYSEAIALLERLSDQGVVRANVSYDRAMAYLMRAQSPKRQAGDLGQAVAALTEARQLDPTLDVEATLAATRREISRRRAQQGLDPVIVEPPLGRAVVELVPETIWAVLGLMSSVVLCIGLVLRTADPLSPRRLAGQICAISGAGALLVFGCLTGAAAHYRNASQRAVIVVAEAPLLDATGKRLTTRALDVEASAIPEGATVYAIGQNGRFTQVNWGSFDAWLETHHLRVLATP